MLAKSMSSIDAIASVAMLSVFGWTLSAVALAAFMAVMVTLKKDVYTAVFCAALAVIFLYNPLLSVIAVMAKSLAFISFNYFTFLDIATAATGAAALSLGALEPLACVMMLYLSIKGLSMYSSL